MYNLEVRTEIDGYSVIVESVRILFPSNDLAIKFILELLKETGRIGY